MTVTSQRYWVNRNDDDETMPHLWHKERPARLPFYQYQWLLAALLLLSIGTTLCLLLHDFNPSNSFETTTNTRDVVAPFVPRRRELQTTVTTTTTSSPSSLLTFPTANVSLTPRQLPQSRRRSKCRKVASWDEFQNCSQGRFLACQPPPPHIDSYETVQRCLHNRTVPIQHRHHIKIYLIGERHSGTKFVVGQLHQCFMNTLTTMNQHQRNNHTTTTSSNMMLLPGIRVVMVKRDFNRHKHFFQNPTLQSLQDMVVISVVRNPYDWVAAMRRKPYHMPNHMNGFDLSGTQPDNNNQTSISKKTKAVTLTKSRRRASSSSSSTVVSPPQPIPLDWHDFVTRPWTTNRSQLDLQIIRDHNTSMAVCTMGFPFDQVIPCQMDPHSLTLSGDASEVLVRGHEPVYELRRDGSGRPFDNILQLRADKIRNFVLQVGSLHLGGFLTVRYEDLLQHGAEPMIRQVARIMLGHNDDEDTIIQALVKSCRPHGPQPHRLFPSSSSRSNIPPDFRQYLRDHIDWDMEKVVGYFPTDAYGLFASSK